MHQLSNLNNDLMYKTFTVYGGVDDTLGVSYFFLNHVVAEFPKVTMSC